MPRPIGILFVASEAGPFIKSGSIGDLAGSLPKVMKTMGHDIRVMLPGYTFINSRRFQIHNLLRMKDIEIPIGSLMERANVKSSYMSNENQKVLVYFLSNERYFSREGLYFHPETKKYFADNDERFIFYCRAVLESLKRLGWQPKVIHCNDWQCGLIPAYLKTIYKDDPFFKNTRTVFTAYTLASHGIFSKNSFMKTGLPSTVSPEHNGNGKLDFFKTGVAFADVVTTLGIKADKKLSGLPKDELTEAIQAHKKPVISLTPTSQNGNRNQLLAEKLITIYRDLAKNG